MRRNFRTWGNSLLRPYAELTLGADFCPRGPLLALQAVQLFSLTKVLRIFRGSLYMLVSIKTRFAFPHQSYLAAFHVLVSIRNDIDFVQDEQPSSIPRERERPLRGP
jgi:hypothetical protein